MLDPRAGEDLYHPSDDEDLREADRHGTGLELDHDELADGDLELSCFGPLEDDQPDTEREPAPWALRQAS